MREPHRRLDLAALRHIDHGRRDPTLGRLRQLLQHRDAARRHLRRDHGVAVGQQALQDREADPAPRPGPQGRANVAGHLGLPTRPIARGAG